MSGIRRKMLLLNLFLLPMTLAVIRELRVNDYIIRIANETLTRVQSTERSSEELNLSGLGLQCIDIAAFNESINLKSLNLSNNSLVNLPECVFSNLTYLEHLSLANNNLTQFDRAFVGLSSLKSLNISNNPVWSLGAGELYGLSKSVDIYTSANTLERLYTTVFDNETPLKRHELRDDNYDDDELREEIENAPRRRLPYKEPRFHVKVCIDQGKVMQLTHMKKGEILPAGCSEVKHDNCCRLYINDVGITDFQKDWYRLNSTDDISFHEITFTGNNINRLTPEILNDLPGHINSIDLSGNKIERLEKGVINNPNIHFLNMNDNHIEEIEEGVFDKMVLWQLRLNGNRLRNTKFLVNLPRGLVKLYLNRNQITELSELPVLNFYRLSHLQIRENNITVVGNKSLRGLPFLLDLDLTKNQIKTLEPGCFKGVKNVYWLHLRDNNIANLDGGVFNGLPRLLSLDLGRNKLTEIKAGFRDSLPYNLKILRLDHNLFENLKAGSFVNVPKDKLDLRGNKISKIERGSFCVPELYGKDLEHEPLDESELLGPLFAGNELALALSGGIPFPTKMKGIGCINLSENPIKRLENGALFGLRKATDNFIQMARTNVELIQGGLFDDV